MCFCYRLDKEDREAEDSDVEEEDEMNGNNDSEEDGLWINISHFC